MILVALPVIIIPPLLTGCAAITPGHSAFVVRAEQTAEASFDIINGYLEFEKFNRNILWAKDHEFKHVADNLRTNSLPAIEALRVATKAYKQNRTSENKATLNTWLAVVDQLILQAQSQLAKAPPPQ